MLVRVETSRVGPARLPSAASWRGSSSFAYRIHWRSGRSGGEDAHVSQNAREFVWGERVTVGIGGTVTHSRSLTGSGCYARLPSPNVVTVNRRENHLCPVPSEY